MKSYGSLSFTKNIGEHFGKNTIKNLSGKHSQKFSDYANQSATDAFKTASKKQLKKSRNCWSFD